MEINLENQTCNSPYLQITNQFISNNESIYNLVVCYESWLIDANEIMHTDFNLEERILAMILAAHVLKQAELS